MINSTYMYNIYYVSTYYRVFKLDMRETLRGLSQITFALRVGRWSEKRVVYYIKSAN